MKTTALLARFKKTVKTHIQKAYPREDVEETVLRAHIRYPIFPPTLKEQIRD